MFLPSSFASNKIIGSVLVEIIIPSFSIKARIIPGLEKLVVGRFFLFLISSAQADTIYQLIKIPNLEIYNIKTG